MENEEAYEFEDEFDPLADGAFEDLEDEEPDNDYSAPVIPDAERSVIPEMVDLPASERIENLLKGIPGQQFRILSAVRACGEEPRPLAEIIEFVDDEFPRETSVYSTGRLVQLLERAGAIECAREEPASPACKTASSPDADEAPGGGAQVQRNAPALYSATRAGLEALAARTGMAQMEEFLQEEPRYIPVYKRILTMCTVEEGRLVQEVNAVVNKDPVCEDPRRYSTYFLRRLEGVGAIRYSDAWRTTDYGKRSLALGLLADAGEAGDLSAAVDARRRQLAEKARFEEEKAQRERQAAERAEMEAAQEAMAAAQAAARGEEPAAPAPERKFGSGGPVFAFPYTPPKGDADGGEADADGGSQKTGASSSLAGPAEGGGAGTAPSDGGPATAQADDVQATE